ncbi:MAG: type II toxin-antitoxin system VapC family toxin [Candidatus Micrarchaeota archaeon]|nr:type II toxin-antitoxin system VapC family toxin [Candidatus Micrarchaeota archaeon]
MTVLIDSWTWIEYWKGGKHAHEAMGYIESDEEAFVSAVNLIELYTWVARDYGETVARSRLESVEARCYIVPLEKGISLDSARLKLKHKLGIADSIVLATAKSVNGKVVTGDSDFKHIDGVVFIG